MLLLVVQRPGSQSVTNEFFDELQLVQSTAHEAVIEGDFDVHVDVSTDSVAQQLNDVLTDNGLCQHVDVATHDRGHTLDLVMDARLRYGRPLSVSGRPCYILPMFFYLFFYDRLILRPWLTEVRESFTRGGP